MVFVDCLWLVFGLHGRRALVVSWLHPTFTAHLDKLVYLVEQWLSQISRHKCDFVITIANEWYIFTLFVKRYCCGKNIPWNAARPLAVRRLRHQVRSYRHKILWRHSHSDFQSVTGILSVIFRNVFNVRCITRLRICLAWRVYMYMIGFIENLETLCIHGATREVADSWWRHQMETFPTLLAFCAGQLRGIARTKASDVELWCFLWSATEPTVENTMDMLESKQLTRHRADYYVIVML